MAKHITTKDFKKAMLARGVTIRVGKRGHSLYLCPCGEHTVTIADAHATIATSIVTTTNRRMPCVTLSF